MNNWKPFGTNILVKPTSKEKIIGTTAKYLLYGEVLDVGDEVKKIKKGDIVGWTLFGIEEIEEKDGSKTFFLQENSDFILAIKHEDQA